MCKYCKVGINLKRNDQQKRVVSKVNPEHLRADLVRSMRCARSESPMMTSISDTILSFQCRCQPQPNFLESSRNSTCMVSNGDDINMSGHGQLMSSVASSSGGSQRRVYFGRLPPYFISACRHGQVLINKSHVEVFPVVAMWSTSDHVLSATKRLA